VAQGVSLAALLKRHRAAAGLTQEELAERAGVSARTISDTERGLRTTVYRDTAERLAAALGLEAETRSEFQGIARGSGPFGAPGGVPAQPTRLIGREVELAAVLDALGSARLVTLIGPGGIGKTRLGAEAAAQANFADGVFFVPLGSIVDPDLFDSVVARVVGASPLITPIFESIVQRLGSARALLVLDTFEHVLAAASMVAELLGRCAGVTVLATSREALHLRGEREIPVPPLELDGPATTLFIERARAVKPDLVIADDIVADICSRLDGVPLAIELAAARAKHLSLDSLCKHLEHGLDVLTGGPRDLPERQRTMRNTVAWSYELLGGDEQALFRVLSVFAGGWALDAVEAITARSNVLETLSALVDKSLVLMSSNGRYGMLDVIREFASERCEERGSLQRTHAGYYLAFAEQAEPEFGAGAQEEWFERIEADHDNMRAALRFALDEQDGELAVRIAGALWQFWRAHQHFDEGRTWLREALRLRSGPHERAKALWGAAWLAFHQDDFDEAGALSVEGLALARQSGDPTDTRNALAVRGMVAMSQRRYAEALKSFEEGLALCRSGEASWLLATSVLNLATATMHAGDLAGAEHLFEEALERYSALGDRRFSNRTKMHIAQVALLSGDAPRARAVAAASLQDNAAIGDGPGIAELLETLSAIDAGTSPANAALIAGAADALRGMIDARPMPFDRDFTQSQLGAARSALSERAWESAWDAGRTLSLDEVIARALEQ
jgi:predicted ATPase/DNA-binding XRE family transcriptional regulator